MAEIKISDISDMTVVPEDGICLINGVVYQDAALFGTDAFPQFRALQYHDSKLVIEPSQTEPNIIVEGEEALTYEGYLEKAVEAVNTKITALEEIAQEQLALYNSEEQRAARVRSARNAKLDETDWIVLRHIEETALNNGTTLIESEYEELLSYRQELRDLTLQDGFPWEGGDNDEIPWPTVTETAVLSLLPL